MFNTCPHCGYINEVDAEVCVSCGEAIKDSGVRKSARQKKAKKRHERRVRSARSSSGERFPWFFFLVLIFLGLVVIGLLHQPGLLAPATITEPETLIVLRGTDDNELVLNGANADFSALAIDPVGVARMELYVDGQLAGARNYETSAEAVFSPALGALPVGEHQAFVRAINSEGKAATSQILAVTVPAGAAGQSGAIETALAQNPLPAPSDLRANSLDQDKRISLTWDEPGQAVDAVRIYVRVPGASGLLHLADLRSEVTQYDFLPDREGVWEVYVAFVAEDGSEGELSFAQLSLPSEGELAESTGGVALPSPTHVQLAVTPAQCQQAADQLSPVRDAYYTACRDQVRNGQHTFLIWRWPLRLSEGQLFSDADLSGFEVKLVLTDAAGKVTGERITAVPFSEMRGSLRTSQDVTCGTQRSWYVRAVGPDGASDWAYAGSLAAESCDLNAPTADGCAGPTDGVAMSRLPEGFRPDLLFNSACESLDRCYADGASGQPKADCDNIFRSSMLAICNEAAGDVDLAVCTDYAEAYYRSANLDGASYYAGERVFDCLDAENRTGCFWGNLPEGVHGVVDDAWGAVSWAGRAAWAGAVKFGEGVVWVVDWGIGTFNTLFP